jgi:16S rRNA (adenine1518-N6/adenine1519-N6)-dimethyltransferase
VVQQVPPEVFYPAPQVDSSVALLTPRADLPAFDRRLFDELLRRGFGQRRKQLHKLLPAGQDWKWVTEQLEVPVTVRAEELDLAKWIHLTQLYDTHPLKDIPQKGSEILDLVNADDEVIGQSTRAEIHAQNLLHRAVHTFVFNKRREVLLQLRSRFKDKHPGVWDSSSAGHIDAGESYATSATRELEEELGITGAALVEIGKLAPSLATGWEFIILYACRHDGALRYPCSEIDSVQWFPLALVEQWVRRSPEDFASGFIECWNLFAASQRDFR